MFKGEDILVERIPDWILRRKVQILEE